MSEFNSRGDDKQVDEIKAFVGERGVRVTEVNGQNEITFNVAELPLITALDPATDEIVFYDTSLAQHRRLKLTDIPTSAEELNTFEVDIQTFGGGSGGSSAGTFTWTKPAGCKAVYVLMSGAGGGGGGGRCAAAATGNRGGLGGGAGGINEIWLPADLLPATVDVTVQAGGAGGLGATVDTTNGANGAAGGYARFGDYIWASGGNGGVGGIASSSPSGSTAGGVRVWDGAAGGGSTDGSGYGGAHIHWGAGGGGGGGGMYSGGSLGNGGAGGVSYFAYTGTPAGGVNSTGNPGANGQDNSAIRWFGGGGAGGGASPATMNGGDGGNGFGGGGGGGGGSARNSAGVFRAGNGGNGGDAWVSVMAVF